MASLQKAVNRLDELNAKANIVRDKEKCSTVEWRTIGRLLAMQGIIELKELSLPEIAKAIKEGLDELPASPSALRQTSEWEGKGKSAKAVTGNADY